MTLCLFLLTRDEQRYVAANALGKREIFHTRVVHSYASANYSIPARGGQSRVCSSLNDVVLAIKVVEEKKTRKAKFDSVAHRRAQTTW